MPGPFRHPVSVLLLAGGRGQRMGGADKGLLDWNGRPLIEAAQRVVRPLTDDLIVSCNRNPDRYRAYGDRLVGDAEPDFPGPLAGIRAGLSVARHAWLLVLPCDCPRIDRDLVERMVTEAQRHQRPLMARRGERWEPLFCVIPTALRVTIEAAWSAGVRAPRLVLGELGAVALPLSEDDPRLANFNTPEALSPASSGTCGKRLHPTESDHPLRSPK